MENPATWGQAERIIAEVHRSWLDNLHRTADERVTGLSLYRQIADALREAGLLREEEK